MMTNMWKKAVTNAKEENLRHFILNYKTPDMAENLF